MNVVMSRSDRQSFGLAVEELPNANLNSTHLCSPFLRVLPVTGVAISTLGAPFGAETVCASDVEDVFAFPMVVGTSERWTSERLTCTPAAPALPRAHGPRGSGLCCGAKG
ncbi:hypothetical protein E3O54_12100 [Cryobacterium sp. TMT2-4]|nr:hypothetical protein E3O54_12100 [Cryobacterium sp. TMT2-4]